MKIFAPHLRFTHPAADVRQDRRNCVGILFGLGWACTGALRSVLISGCNWIWRRFRELRFSAAYQFSSSLVSSYTRSGVISSMQRRASQDLFLQARHVRLSDLTTR